MPVSKPAPPIDPTKPCPYRFRPRRVAPAETARVESWHLRAAIKRAQMATGQASTELLAGGRFTSDTPQSDGARSYGRCGLVPWPVVCHRLTA